VKGKEGELMLREKANELTQQQRVLSEKGETKMDVRI